MQQGAFDLPNDVSEIQSVEKFHKVCNLFSSDWVILTDQINNIFVGNMKIAEVISKDY